MGRIRTEGDPREFTRQPGGRLSGLSGCGGARAVPEFVRCLV